MRTYKILTISALAAVLFAGCAQHYALKGDQAYDRLAYAEAIDKYQKIKDDKKDYKTKVRLADSYHFNNEPEEAAHWYGEAMKDKPLDQVEEDVLLRYAQALESTGQHELASDYYHAYFKDNTTDIAAFVRMLSADTLDDDIKSNDRYEVAKLDINQNNRSSMSPVYYKDQYLVFTSERNRTLQNEKSPWTGRPFVDMYCSEIKEDGSLGTPKTFAKDVQTKFDDGTVTFSPDYKTMYFTRTNYVDGEVETDDNNVANLQIFRATMKDGKWGEAELLPFNSRHNCYVHPALSEDGRRLYFASDMPGGLGGSDLYVAQIDENGNVGEPRNLGYMVNTERDDLFPTVVSENGHDVLYFASEGHAGYGGLDIFRTHAHKWAWSKPEILPAPINSIDDDFGIAFQGEFDHGYFTSTRASEDGIDAIYKFDRFKDGTLKVVAVEEGTTKSLEDVRVTVQADEKKQDVSKRTDEEGSAHFTVEPNESYIVSAQSKGYLINHEPEVTTRNLDGDTLLSYVILKPAPGSELTFQDVAFTPIYFDFDEYDIRENEAKDLDKLADYMKSNLNVTIQLKGHADSRGSDEYNIWLSHMRADATREYLESKGVSGDRISTTGFGESKLVNDCDEISDDCSEEQHQKNRRTVIELVKEEELTNTTSSNF